MVGWSRRIRLSPPPLVLVRFRRPPLFFFLSLSGFARCGLGVLVLVFSPSPVLLLHSPSRVPVKKFSSHLHFSFHLCPMKTLSARGDMESDQLHLPATIFICCYGTWLTREPPCRPRQFGFLLNFSQPEPHRPTFRTCIRILFGQCTFGTFHFTNP